jgi:NADPH:quinone reductase-like Zn-dependent oxidoreductase
VSDHISAPNVSIDDSAGTSDFKLGDKVFGLAYGGAVSKPFIEEQAQSHLICGQYSQMISVSEKMVMHIPANMAFETAAGIPEVGPEKFLENRTD